MSTRRRVFITGSPAVAEETDKDFLAQRPPSESQLLMKFADAKEQYFQIDRQMLLPDTSIDFTMFKQSGMHFGCLLKATPESPVRLTEELLRALFCDPCSEIVIERSSTSRYQAYLEAADDAARALPEDKRLARKAVAVKEDSKILIKDFLDSTGSTEKLEIVNDAVVNIVGSLWENMETIYDMITLRKFDYYTYTHSVNVAVLSAGLGVVIGLSRDNVVDLGIGAMLHDVGKTTVPPMLLNKQGKLDAHEYRIVQGHVRQGGAILREHNAISEPAFDALLQHHEKLSGRGYPFKLRGEEISLFGRISGIADCYDALTTNRPYRSALTPYEALQVISKDVGDYDSDLLADFVKMLGKVKKGEG
jgi:HD-GYP domain-containing protein (c-di-GMP phosphodiesterase class II)